MEVVAGVGSVAAAVGAGLTPIAPVRRTAAVISSAATIVAAFGLGGCAAETPPAATSTPAASGVSSPAAPPSAPLPAPEALTDVIHRLADTAVPGAQKLDLVDGTTPEDAEALDAFARALADNGYAPLDVEARDLAWSDADHGDVDATVVLKPARDGTAGEFSFPMEFTPHDGGWQLTRRTADQLLVFGTPEPAPVPPATPTP